MALQAWPTVANRNVAQPSRVRLTQASGTDADVYDVTPVPGTVVNEGTLINQALFDQMEQYVKEYDIPIHKTTGTGAAYAVSVPVWSNLTQTELDGHILCIIPHVVSTTVSPTLNMNGLGAKPIYAPGGSSTSDRGNLPIASYLTANVPVYLIYNKSGDCWITLNAATTPVATNTTVGTVKPDTSTVTIDSTGQLSVPTATAATKGLVKPDDATITVDDSGLIKVNTATTDNLGIVKPDTTTISVDSTGKLSANQASNIAKGIVIPDTTTMDVDSNGKISVKKATSSTAGIIKPDGNTIGIDADGTIKANIATTSAVGVNKPDGITITIASDGTLTSNAKDEIAAQHERDQLEFANALIGNKSGTLVNVDDAWGVKALKAGVDGKCEQTVGVWGTNLITNGDFSSGTTGWKSHNTSALTIVSGAVCYTPVGMWGGLRRHPTLPATVGHKYYLRALVKTASTNTSLYFGGVHSTVSKGSGGFETLSGVGTAFNTAEFAISTSETGNFSETFVDNALAIDLTAAFGAGNEPTAEQMDAYLAAYPNSWFDGSALLTTNGTPNSPSPEYPQEVDVVDGPVSVVRTGANIIGALLRDKASAAVNVSQDMDNGTMSIRPDAPTSSWCNVTKMYYVGDNKTVNASVYANIATGLLHKLTIYNSIDGVRIGKQVGVSESIATSGTLRATGTVSTNYVAIRYWVNYSVVAAGTIAPTVFTEMMLNIGSTTLPYEPYTSTQQTITLPPDHNYLASLSDGTRDELVLRADGVAVLVERTKKIVASEVLAFSEENMRIAHTPDARRTSGGNEIVCNRSVASFSNNWGCIYRGEFTFNVVMGLVGNDVGISTIETADAWLKANPVTFYYSLLIPAIKYSADNGATWSTTDPAAGQSAIPLHKGTNNIWCTDAVSPTVDLEYVQDTNKVIDKLRAAIVASGASS